MSEKKVVEINAVEISDALLNIEGNTPLIEHKFSDKSKEGMMDKHLHKTKERGTRDIKSEVEESIHRLPDGGVGFPSAGFKKSMIEAAPYLSNVNKKQAKGSFFIIGELVPIEFEEMVINEAVGRIGPSKTAKVVFRPQFNNWKCTLHIRYNRNQISLQEIVNLANLGGFHIGVGDWTPQHGGQYGQYKVANGGQNEKEIHSR